MVQKKRVILWGAGNIAKSILINKYFFQTSIDIICVVDNDKERWGKYLEGVEIVSPNYIYNVVYDKIIIATDVYFDEIREQLVCELGIDEGKIENRYYFAKEKILAKYTGSADLEICKIVDYLQEHRLDVFNSPFVEKYRSMKVDMGYDTAKKMYYVMHYGKRMYMSRKLNTEEKVLRYYRSICLEQDENSPHLYITKEFDVAVGDVVVDVGVAEGNFALGIIEKVSKIYLIEADSDWVEALLCTFESYRDKVVIFNKFVSDFAFGEMDTLDNLINEKVNFIKMDVEGSEVEVMAGASKIIGEADNLKCVVCTYHRDNDEVAIEKLAAEVGLEGEGTKGYMWYPVGDKQLYISPVLRKGVMRYEKKC